jgi:hypothetical protein
VTESEIQLCRRHHSDWSIFKAGTTSNWGGARGSVGDWGTILQAGKPRVRFLMRSLDF